MRWILLLLAMGTLFGQDEPAKVTADLIANRSTVVKGEPFLLGIHLKMSDHWHTYWEFPGFSGLPTTWKLEPVEGLEIKKLRFPLPKKFTDEAGFVTYGFDDEALLTAEAVYSGEKSEIVIKGDIDWLQCKELCIPGKEKVTLTLKVGARQDTNGPLFEKYLALSPTPFDEKTPFSYHTEYKFEGELWHGKLELTPEAGTILLNQPEAVKFFPLGNEASELDTAKISFQDGKYVFELTYKSWEEQPPENLVLNGVVSLPTEDGSLNIRIKLFPMGNQPTASVTPAPAIQSETNPSGAEPGFNLAFFTILLFAFIGGMILNLMPCVLPVLSLKVFSLLKDAGESKLRRIQFGWVYTLGIAASFLVLSVFFVAAKLAGEQLGVGFQFQSPGFVIGIAALIFVMGLSFAGVFHIGAPNSGRLQKMSMESGYRGAFFQGALMTLLSTPCTAPLLGAAYGWALAQDPGIIILTFQIIALGLASPYLLLCYLPGLLKFLPKPGPWMDHFKTAMGFLLLATVIWLFKVLGDLTGVDGIVGLLLLLLALGVACTIYGKTAHSEKRIPGFINAVIILAIGVKLGLFGIFDIRHPKQGKVAREEALRLKFMSEGINDETLFALLNKEVTTAEELAWVPYTAENLAYFREQNRLVFLDFTATWCLTCKANEALVIDTAAIRKLFAENNMVTMKADYTDRSDELTEFIKSFNRAGVPLYVIFPAQNAPIVLPETITKSIVTNAVEEAVDTMTQNASL